MFSPRFKVREQVMIEQGANSTTVRTIPQAARNMLTAVGRSAESKHTTLSY
jgi:hypothetical protein